MAARANEIPDPLDILRTDALAFLPSVFVRGIERVVGRRNVLAFLPLPAFPVAVGRDRPEKHLSDSPHFPEDFVHPAFDVFGVHIDVSIQ